MSTKSKATQLGSYVCKVGKYDIRHKIVQPKTGKNNRGEIITSTGSVTASVYLGRELFKGGFNDHSKAIQHIWNKLKRDGVENTVSNRVIKKYNLY